MVTTTSTTTGTTPINDAKSTATNVSVGPDGLTDYIRRPTAAAPANNASNTQVETGKPKTAAELLAAAEASKKAAAEFEKAAEAAKTREVEEAKRAEAEKKAAEKREQFEQQVSSVIKTYPTADRSTAEAVVKMQNKGTSSEEITGSVAIRAANRALNPQTEDDKKITPAQALEDIRKASKGIDQQSPTFERLKAQEKALEAKITADKEAAARAREEQQENAIKEQQQKITTQQQQIDTLKQDAAGVPVREAARSFETPAKQNDGAQKEADEIQTAFKKVDAPQIGLTEQYESAKKLIDTVDKDGKGTVSERISAYINRNQYVLANLEPFNNALAYAKAYEEKHPVVGSDGLTDYIRRPVAATPAPVAATPAPAAATPAVQTPAQEKGDELPMIPRGNQGPDTARGQRSGKDLDEALQTYSYDRDGNGVVTGADLKAAYADMKQNDPELAARFEARLNATDYPGKPKINVPAMDLKYRGPRGGDTEPGSVRTARFAGAHVAALADDAPVPMFNDEGQPQFGKFTGEKIVGGLRAVGNALTGGEKTKPEATSSTPERSKQGTEYKKAAEQPGSVLPNNAVAAERTGSQTTNRPHVGDTITAEQLVLTDAQKQALAALPRENTLTAYKFEKQAVIDAVMIGRNPSELQLITNAVEAASRGIDDDGKVSRREFERKFGVKGVIGADGNDLPKADKPKATGTPEPAAPAAASAPEKPTPQANPVTFNLSAEQKAEIAKLQDVGFFKREYRASEVVTALGLDRNSEQALALLKAAGKDGNLDKGELKTLGITDITPPPSTPGGHNNARNKQTGK